ncbi:uncharacterized protein LOC132559502 [Ylistrum balloti]|uniref:uncharacterized protein LOC132559502 n=1 Tax=Ylistrum balloti TaxID=509963 RepID=UPI002905B85E|nr:uncharacterized protein LOC132559502 [Ylistrum balloti]
MLAVYAFVRRLSCLRRTTRIYVSRLQTTKLVCSSNFKDNRQFTMSTVTSLGSSWLKEILEEQSTQNHYIEYRTFFSNHIAHGIIAIERLGGDQNRVKRFVDDYKNKVNLEPPNHPRHNDESTDADPATDDELHKLLGQRKLFYKLRNRYIMKLKEYGSLEEILRAEFPNLSRGLVCSAAHGLIHTGYGYSARCPTTVTEGLAYLHHSCKPLIFDEKNSDNDISHFGKGDTDILVILEELAKDEQLRIFMKEEAVKLSKSDWASGGFQYKVAALMSVGDNLLKYAYKIKVPVMESFKDEADLVVAVADWLLNQSIAVYALSDMKNNFFLLHGVTAAWSLRQIIPVLKPADAVDALRTFTCALLAVYVSQECPALTNKPKVPQSDVTASDWTDVINEVLSRDTDEHIYKLVQVCHDLWREKDCSNMADIYLHAAQTSMDNDLSFGNVS